MSTGKMKNPIAIFGAGGFGREVSMLIQHINAAEPCWEIIGFFDDGMPKNTRINDWFVLGGLKDLNNWPNPLAVVFALGIPGVKKNVIERVNNSNLTFPNLIHPAAILGPQKYLNIGEGCIICAGTIITTNISVGKHVIFNLVCTVGHDVIIGDFCSFMPGCNISGEVNIGAASFWGTGAKVINRKNVGSDTVIGAGAVVISDIPPHTTAVGIPAKVIRSS